MLPELHLEPPCLLIYFNVAARKSILNRAVQRFTIPKHADRRQRRRQIRSIVVQDWRKGADLRNANR